MVDFRPPLSAESAPTMCMTTPVVEAPPVVMEYVHPALVVGFVAPAPAASYAAPARHCPRTRCPTVHNTPSLVGLETTLDTHAGPLHARSLSPFLWWSRPSGAPRGAHRRHGTGVSQTCWRRIRGRSLQAVRRRVVLLRGA